MARRRAFGTIEQRSPRPGFYVVFHWQGRRYRRSVGPSKKVATQKLSTVHALLEGGMPIGEVLAEVFGDASGARMTFRQAAPLYLEHAEREKKSSTFAVDATRLRAILRAPWTGRYLSAITVTDLVRWADQRKVTAPHWPSGWPAFERIQPKITRIVPSARAPG